MRRLTPLTVSVLALAVVLLVGGGALAYRLAPASHARGPRAGAAPRSGSQALRDTRVPRPYTARHARLASSAPTPMDGVPVRPSATDAAARAPAGPTATATPASSPTATATSSATATPVPSATVASAPTTTPTPRPMATATNSPTSTPTAPTATATITPSATAVPLQLGGVQFSLFTVNPQFTTQQVAFTLSRPARVRIQIVPDGQARPVRTMNLGRQPAGTVQASWNGRDDSGRLVPEGTYAYHITATGAAGTRATESYDGLGVTYKRMVVSLSRQQLTAYDGTTQFLSTLVTTGNPALPTPLGTFTILAKYHPFTFVSPWPPGSQFYYAPSTVNYALLFDNRGYYVHDAPWRTVYGPGTNTQLGTPGTNYTGTHGCVNVPLAAEQQLFDWAPIGTIVQVVP